MSLSGRDLPPVMDAGCVEKEAGSKYCHQSMPTTPSTVVAPLSPAAASVSSVHSLSSLPSTTTTTTPTTPTKTIMTPMTATLDLPVNNKHSVAHCSGSNDDDDEDDTNDTNDTINTPVNQEDGGSPVHWPGPDSCLRVFPAGNQTPTDSPTGCSSSRSAINDDSDVKDKNSKSNSNSDSDSDSSSVPPNMPSLTTSSDLALPKSVLNALAPVFCPHQAYSQMAIPVVPYPAPMFAMPVSSCPPPMPVDGAAYTDFIQLEHDFVQRLGFSFTKEVQARPPEFQLVMTWEWFSWPEQRVGSRPTFKPRGYPQVLTPLMESSDTELSRFSFCYPQCNQRQVYWWRAYPRLKKFTSTAATPADSNSSGNSSRSGELKHSFKLTCDVYPEHCVTISHTWYELPAVVLGSGKPKTSVGRVCSPSFKEQDGAGWGPHQQTTAMAPTAKFLWLADNLHHCRVLHLTPEGKTKVRECDFCCVCSKGICLHWQQGCCNVKPCVKFCHMSWRCRSQRPQPDFEKKTVDFPVPAWAPQWLDDADRTRALVAWKFLQ